MNHVRQGLGTFSFSLVDYPSLALVGAYESATLLVVKVSAVCVDILEEMFHRIF